ncbi:MAG: amidase family protein, partial [Gammaproteobacteria bacterium]
MSNDLWRLDATDVAAGISNRDFSSREVVTSCLERLDAVNPQLNAVVESRPDEALAAADKADQAVADGKALGLLHGVPVTIKSIHDLAGWATVNGCAALKDNVASVSSPCVQNWLDAGVVVLGRTNTPEYRNKDNPKDKGNCLMASCIGLPTTLEQYVDFSMIAQAEGLKFG